MTNRIFNPDIQYLDGTGTPLAGAQLFAYVTGTSTKQNTYSNSALTIANPNPIVLDSNGRVGACFLQNLPYKIVLAPSTDTDPPTSPIWTQDPVYTSDYSTVAQVQGVNGNPNGQLAGTQGSATIPASMAWDYTNDILYICTTTGTSTTAVWTAVNPASGATGTLPVPQGRLTLVTQTPIISSDAISATTVYYTPYTGLLVPIYNGTSFSALSIVSQLTLGLVAAHAANQIYDLYVFLISGVATLGSGPSWGAGSGGSVTAGSCARGTGGGGAALSILNGILTNAVNMVMTYGNSGATTTISANQATYVGSMFMDSTNGQITCNVSWGQSRKFGIWNAYNRVPIALQSGDSTSTWAYALSTPRQANGATGNTIVAFTGLAEEPVSASYTDLLFYQYSGSAGGGGNVGIGWNSTSVFSGTTSQSATSVATGTVVTSCLISVTGLYVAPPSLGINNVNAVEAAITGYNNGFTGHGTQANMLLEAEWRG
jgi:hypothetical protein